MLIQERKTFITNFRELYSTKEKYFKPQEKNDIFDAITDCMIPNHSGFFEYFQIYEEEYNDVLSGNFELWKSIPKICRNYNLMSKSV